MKKKLPLWCIEKFRESQESRLEVAANVAGALLEAVNLVPNGGPSGAELVTSTLPLLRLVVGDDVMNGVSRVLASPVEQAARMSTLTLEIGTSVPVRDVVKCELVEVLVRAQSTLGSRRLKLVPPSILFLEAVNNFDWSGTLIEFTLPSGISHMVPQHVCLHPSASFELPLRAGIPDLRVRSLERRI